MARISTDQLRLFEELHNSRLQDFKTLNKKSYRGVWGSIIDKYPESAHFVYELLQNADDSEATEATFTLKDDLLLFKHNGSKHFDITSETAKKVGDINSITGIGDSSKIDTQNKIGKFGVGFKAVFQYSEIPEIYDDTFKFKIEDYIVPTLLDHDYPGRKEGETLFVLRLKNSEKSYSDISARLRNLQSPILFLRSLQRVTWNICDSHSGTSQAEYSKKLNESFDYATKNGPVKVEHYRINEHLQSNDIFLFSQNVPITDESGNASTHLISIGFYYDAENKALITNKIQNIFCFFPTKETFKTCFVAHAPFYLTDNRQNLKPSNQVNTSLLGLLAELAARAVVWLRDYGIKNKIELINENITEIIPSYTNHSYGWIDDEFEEPIRKAFYKVLQKEPLLLSRNGRYLSVSEAFIGSPRELVDLLTQEQLAFLNKAKFQSNQANNALIVENSDSSGVDFLKWELSQNIAKNNGCIGGHDIKNYSSASFAKDITSAFMSSQNKAWVIKLYNFLRNYAPKLWKSTSENDSSSLPFRHAPIIKVQGGSWIVPYKQDGISPNVFLPLKDISQSEYNFVDSEYLKDSWALKFFDELDIKQPDVDDYIRAVILTKYEPKEYGENDIGSEVLIADLHAILDRYVKVRDTPAKIDFIGLIDGKLQLRGTDERLHKPSDLYFESAELSAYFNCSAVPVFFDADFYAQLSNLYGATLVKEFVSELGCSPYPKILNKERSSVFGLSNRLRQKIDVSGYKEHYISHDYELEGFRQFAKGKDVDKRVSIWLWNVVLPAVNPQNYECMWLRYRLPRTRNFRDRTFRSTLWDDLLNEKWVYDSNDDPHSPNDIAMEDLASDYNRYNGLVESFNIKKREKSILELGGTEEQQKQLDFAKRIKSLAGNELTEEEVMQAIRDFKENKKSRKANQSGTTPAGCSKPEGERDLESGGTVARGQGIGTNHAKKPDENNSGSNIPDNSTYSGEELRPTDINEMFVDASRPTRSKSDDFEEQEDSESDVQAAIEKIAAEEDKRSKIQELRKTVRNSDRYSKEWFEALIELEYRDGMTSERHDKSDSSKYISITFASASKEAGSDGIYIFGKPSRGIPMWMEEVSDIDVNCSFLNRDDLTLKFEVASVRNNSLLLKAGRAYEGVLKKVDWSRFAKATITLKNQIDLMGKLRTAFNSLGFSQGFNLKNGLPDNINFVFGPPGTGKTTHLAEKIAQKMKANSWFKVLVLAPTNKACDELALKIIECSENSCPWLGRFVSTADKSLESCVVDRDSAFYKNSQCCLVSTITRLSFDGFDGLLGGARLTDIPWNEIICDESSMIPLAEMMLCIYSFRGKPITIAGDPMQIKPIVHEEQWKDENIYSMVRLESFANPTTEPRQFKVESLDVQYRSLPAIGELFSRYAYDGRIKHARKGDDCTVHFTNPALKPINFISFRVERYNSIFGVKKLDGSNVHIYSALFTVEFFRHIVREYASAHNEPFSIGIICPYAPQAQLIESLISQTEGIPDFISVAVGTVHRFQGGQCDFMIVVLNPPAGLTVASSRIFLNNKNILNVAISRAKDCLCIMLPHRDTDGYENLYEINRLGKIAQMQPDNVGTWTSDQMEEMFFGRKYYIENNTFITAHQLTNVYTKSQKKYEVRIDDKSVDVQIGTGTS